MYLTDGFFHSLQRHFINGRLRDISRAEDQQLQSIYSSAWLPDHPEHRGPYFNSSNTPSKKLDDILQGIGRYAGIILGSNYTLAYSSEDGQFLERPSDRTLVVSYEPFSRPPKGYSFLDSVDVAVGQVIHDAAYLREKQNAEKKITDNDTLHTLYLLVEDVLVDSIIALEYPGYEGYLFKYRHYFVDGKLRGRWRLKMEGRLFQTMLALRSAKPVRIDRKSVRNVYFYMLNLLARNYSIGQLRAVNRGDTARMLYSILFDEKIYAHWGMVNHRSERFVFGKDGPPEQGEDGNQKGGKLNPITSRTLQNIQHSAQETVEDDSAAESSMKHAVKKIRSPFLKKNDRTVSGPNTEKMISPDGVDKQFEYQLRMFVPELYYGGLDKYNEAVVAVKAQITQLEKHFSQARMQIPSTLSGLKSGTLDEDLLYRAKYSNELFKKPAVQARQNGKLDIVLLVDASSSMQEIMEGSDIPRYKAAQRMTALFVEALERSDSIQTWVYSFYARDKQVDVLELYSPSLRGKERIGDIYPFRGHQTPEYEALLAVSRYIQMNARPGVPKVFIVFSDGDPDDFIIPGQEQMNKIRALSYRLGKGGNYVIQVALGPTLSFGKAYPNFIPFPKAGYPELIRRFGAMLKRLID